jgi:hypothetical protein
LVSDLDNMLQMTFAKFVSERKRDASESYRIAVMKPAFWASGQVNPNPDFMADLGRDMYQTISQLPSFSITHADEPIDPSALAYLNRGGDWPFLPTNVKPNEAWQGDRVHKKPNLERLFRVGQDLGLDALVMWFYAIPTNPVPFPVEVYVVDVEKQRIYLHKGTNTEASTLVKQALSDFHAGREGYRIAVIKPYYRPGSNLRELTLGGEIYRLIVEQPSFSITYADEPDDSSARNYLNRGGDWPFPSTNVDPNEVWQGDLYDEEPSLDRLFQAGRDLEVDAVVMWLYHSIWMASDWPVEVYVIDIDKQRLYSHKGTNHNVNALVRQAFDDFVAGRKP